MNSSVTRRNLLWRLGGGSRRHCSCRPARPQGLLADAPAADLNGASTIAPALAASFSFS